jgi:hypothetical protein
VTDQASYRTINQSAWVNLQYFPTDRLELYAHTLWNAGTATIDGFRNDPSNLLAQPAGLDFVLMSDAFAGFSDLRLRHTIQSAGLNYRLGDAVVINGAFSYNSLRDAAPHLYDATGRRLGVIAGVIWVI